MNRLKDKVAVITNAAGLLGSSQALLFAEEGAVLVLTDRDADRGAEIAMAINAQGGQALFHTLDVAVEDQWDALGRAIDEEHAGFDILVHNATFSTTSRSENISRGEFDDVLAANSRGAFLGVRLALESMRRRGGGSIVNVSSIAGIIPPSNSSEAYAASSGALRILTKDVSADYAADNIRCNSLHAGLIGTTFANCDEVLSPSAIAEYLVVTPMRRVGTPREVANGVLFLASDEASYVTGTELIIDGGMVGY